MTIFKIYCDESRQQESSGYKLMGSIWIKSEYGWPFVNDFEDYCKREIGSIPGHLKWTKVPPPQSLFFQYYRSLVDCYFEYNSRYKETGMFFKAIIADKDYKFNHPIYNQGDEEKGFYKLYHTLFQRSLSNDCRYHLRIAERSVPNEDGKLGTLQECLNSWLIKNSGYTFWDDLIVTAEPRPARERRLIQLADIFTGAIGYHWNGLHLAPNAKAGKVSLADYIAGKLKRKDLKYETFQRDRQFNIFKFRSQK